MSISEPTEPETKDDKVVDEKKEEAKEEQEQEEEEFDLIAMLNAKIPAKLNIKDLPKKRNRKGHQIYFGYMDDFFQNEPPKSVTNIIFDNASLQILADLNSNL
jgi:hypothetical protein